MRQDVAVAQTTFYRVTGLKSLANHQLRSYHTHKVWCRGADESLIECGKCKGTPPFLPLNGMTTLRSYLSLFTSDT